MQLYIRGDPETNWQETADGFSVVVDDQRKGKRRRFMYGRRNDTTGGVQATDLEVGKGDPATRGLRKRGERPKKDRSRKNRSAFYAAEFTDRRRSAGMRT